MDQVVLYQTRHDTAFERSKYIVFVKQKLGFRLSTIRAGMLYSFKDVCQSEALVDSPLTAYSLIRCIKTDDPWGSLLRAFDLRYKRRLQAKQRYRADDFRANRDDRQRTS